MPVITRKDVAAKAGVSVTVVSRVLTCHGYVAKDKKQAVLKAARELGYRPNPIAVSLQRQRTRQLLFCCKNLSNQYVIELFRGMVHQAIQDNYSMLLSGTLNLEKIKEMMVDGVILANEFDADYFAVNHGLEIGIPVVAASHGVFIKPPYGIPFVETDVSLGMLRMIDYLRSKGHKRIAFASPYKLSSNQPRHTAFLSQMEPVYMDRISEYFFSLNMDQTGSVDTEENFGCAGEQVAEIFFKRKSDATAIICFNDAFAMGMLKQLYKLGVHVPGDISLTGFDGVFANQYTVPSLTSVDIAPFLQGIACVKTLIAMLDGNAPPRIYRMPDDTIRIIEGDSINELSGI